MWQAYRLPSHKSEEPWQEGGDICDPGAAQDGDLEWEECGLLGNIFPAREVGMR